MSSILSDKIIKAVRQFDSAYKNHSNKPINFYKAAKENRKLEEWT